MENLENLVKTIIGLTDQNILIWESSAPLGANKAIDWQNSIHPEESKWALVVSRDGGGEALVIQHTSAVVDATQKGLKFSFLSCVIAHKSFQLLNAIDRQYQRLKKYEYSGIQTALREKPRIDGCGVSLTERLSPENVLSAVFDMLKKI